MTRIDNSQVASAQLTARQRQLLDYFNSINDEAQDFIVNVAKRYTTSFPRQRPALRVVIGGAA
jgi:hypothetical protein